MTQPFLLPQKIDLSTVENLVAALREEQGDICLDGSQVTHLGALGLQVLISASKTARSRNCTFELLNGSETMIEHMAIMGVTTHQLTEGSL